MGEERDTPWDPEHLKILKWGAWNSWRSANPGIVPKLVGVDLSVADLSGADLRRACLGAANLKGAYLREANLREADLSEADLRFTDLSGADLSEAKLHETCFSRASLDKANFRKALLTRANFDDAHLNETSFEAAFAYRTSFQTPTLGSARGLEKIRHLGPSSVGPEVLEACGPELPDAFLKGIGFKDWEILAIKLRDPNLRPDQVIDITYKIADMRTNSPIQTNSIFFSYSSKDASFIEAIEKRFNEDHINSWRDVHEISAGPIEAQLERAINLNGTVLLVLSKNSVHSEWVKYEVRKARKLQAKLEEENEKQMHVLCPVALDDSWKNCAWPPRIREDLEDYHILDCSDWQEPSFDAKYEKLKTNLGIYYFGQGST